MTRLRVGVVGLGIGQAHLLAYVLAPEQFEVVAIADTDAGRRERAARDWGVAAVSTLDELLDLDLDVVDLCTPPALHEEQCIRVLRTGRHVVCEKPLVSSLDALARLEEAEAAADGVLMPIFQYRFAPGIARMKAVVDAGLCGRLYLATSETAWLRGDDYYAAPWRGTFAGEGGGAVFGHGTHAHDLLSHIAGPLVTVQGRVATLVNDIETEDTAVGIGATADGGLVSMAVTLGSQREITRLRFCFEHVTAESSLEPYEPGNEPWTFDWSSPARAAEADAVWAGLPATPSGFAGQLAAFHRAVTDGGPLPVTLADARRALELVTGWYESARTGATVRLDN
ncbi:MAG: Gfo/Idh/MocA family oxidoreductase [Acidimicrobiales bacterium]